ncbi:hypothetical protein [Lacticaseibacillus absianus]|uniref:hypothetical protein n=1 Tax=Lacticaseibacillus absianus TaxID=2729623 RepID=UPI0015CD4602|nr:hypothetical protein [Lacticaseibacillus absianus]
MNRSIKVLLALVVGLVVTLPAMGLVVAVLGVAALLAGVTWASVSGPLSVAAGGLAIGVGLLVTLLLGGWCTHFHHASLYCRLATGVHRVPVTIDLCGRTICAQLWLKVRLQRRRGQTWSSAIEQAVAAYFGDDLRDYLLRMVQEQHGVAVADAMSLADEHTYHFSL